MVNKDITSSLANGLKVATAGMVVQNKRVLIISQNLANAGSRSDEDKDPYRRKMVRFAEHLDPKSGASLVKVEKVIEDKSPFNLVFDPRDPAADEEGFVKETNIRPMVELSDIREAGRSHESNVKVFERILQMLNNTVGLLKA